MVEHLDSCTQVLCEVCVCCLCSALPRVSHSQGGSLAMAPHAPPRQTDRHMLLLPSCNHLVQSAQQRVWGNNFSFEQTTLLSQVWNRTCSRSVKQQSDSVKFKSIWDSYNWMWCIPELRICFPAVQTHRQPPEPSLPPVPTNKRLIGVFTHDTAVPEPAPLAGPCA